MRILILGLDGAGKTTILYRCVQLGPDWFWCGPWWRLVTSCDPSLTRVTAGKSLYEVAFPFHQIFSRKNLDNFEVWIYRVLFLTSPPLFWLSPRPNSKIGEKKVWDFIMGVIKIHFRNHLLGSWEGGICTPLILFPLWPLGGKQPKQAAFASNNRLY